MEETILSQKMTELTTTITTMNHVNIDHTLISMDKKIQDHLEILPSYLTKDNKTFQSMIDQALLLMSLPISNDDKRNDLEQISILIYKINILSKYSSLWATYWKSGMGQLIQQTPEQPNHVVYAKYISIWPKEIKRRMKLIKENDENNKINSMSFVDYHREELQRQLTQTQMKWNQKANQCSGYNFKVEKFLESYIDQHLHEFNMEIEHKIKLVTYDYQTEAIKREFDLKNPTEYQNKLMKEACLKRYEHETAEQDYQLLQERIHHFNRSSESFKCLAPILATMIDSIENNEIREQLYDQYMNIVEQSKTDFSNLSLKTAEEQRNRTKLNYNKQIRKMWSIHDNAIDSTTLPLQLIDLILERCRMIGERIQSVSEYQLKCFRSKSNIRDNH